LPVPSACETTIDRCLKYYPQVIREAHHFGGLDAPAHEMMAQIEQESRCDEGITAFDGGAGLGQFMPATADWIQQKEPALQQVSPKAAPYDPRWAIRALVLYDIDLYGEVLCPSWWNVYRAYNGGAGQLNREIRRSGSCNRDAIEAACSRKVIKTKWGPLDLCWVNCDYPRQIEKRSRKYMD
jgi:hypothetical protein